MEKIREIVKRQIANSPDSGLGSDAGIDYSSWTTLATSAAATGFLAISTLDLAGCLCRYAVEHAAVTVLLPWQCSLLSAVPSRAFFFLSRWTKHVWEALQIQGEGEDYVDTATHTSAVLLVELGRTDPLAGWAALLDLAQRLDALPSVAGVALAAQRV